MLVRAVRGGSGPCGSPLPSTGIRDCYDDGGRVIPCDNPEFPGQDPYYRTGCPLEGRFLDNEDGTITDLCTGLMWQKATAFPGAEYGPDEYGDVIFKMALQYAQDLRLGGHTDWRIPNILELLFIGTWDPLAMERPHLYPFEFPLQAGAKPAWRYWSSTVQYSNNQVVIFLIPSGYAVFDLGRNGPPGALVRCVRGPVEIPAAPR
jgi:hypothetical protein